MRETNTSRTCTTLDQSNYCLRPYRRLEVALIVIIVEGIAEDKDIEREQEREKEGEE